MLASTMLACLWARNGFNARGHNDVTVFTIENIEGRKTPFLSLFLVWLRGFPSTSTFPATVLKVPVCVRVAEMKQKTEGIQEQQKHIHNSGSSESVRTTSNSSVKSIPSKINQLFVGETTRTESSPAHKITNNPIDNKPVH